MQLKLNLNEKNNSLLNLIIKRITENSVIINCKYRN